MHPCMHGGGLVLAVIDPEWCMGGYFQCVHPCMKVDW